MQRFKSRHSKSLRAQNLVDMAWNFNIKILYSTEPFYHDPQYSLSYHLFPGGDDGPRDRKRGVPLDSFSKIRKWTADDGSGANVDDI